MFFCVEIGSDWMAVNKKPACVLKLAFKDLKFFGFALGCLNGFASQISVFAICNFVKRKVLLLRDLW